MRASRLLSILLLLQARGRMTAQALADELEISVRTVHRDIDDLSASGVPVYADRGRTGGFQLLDGYRTQLTGLTPAEAEALFLAGLPGPAAEMGLGDAMAVAQLKLLAALPGERAEAPGRVAARFHLDPVGWYRHAERTDILPVLAQAVWNPQKIRVRYGAWNDVVDRELEPLGLVLKAGVWYLVASAGGKARTYRVSSIQDLELAAEGFERPAGFELAAYWNAWSRDFEARLYTGEATVRLSPRGMWMLSQLPQAVGEMAVRTAGARDPDGWVTAQIPIESIDHAAGEVLKLGVEAQVVEPAELRARMGEIAGRLGAMYG
jgi:predicted DNA-binding transcriptional regulator YafY